MYTNKPANDAFTAVLFKTVLLAAVFITYAHLIFALKD